MYINSALKQELTRVSFIYNWQNDPKGERVLHVAIDKNNNEATLILLQSNADINQKNDKGETPLYRAAINSNYQIANMLLDRGAEVNIRNVDNWTPLKAAIYKEDANLVKLLLKNGADINSLCGYYFRTLEYLNLYYLVKLSCALCELEPISRHLTPLEIQENKDLIILSLKNQLTDGHDSKIINYAISNLNALYSDINIIDLIANTTKGVYRNALTMLNYFDDNDQHFPSETYITELSFHATIIGATNQDES
jgi:ankyrin repeat protein